MDQREQWHWAVQDLWDAFIKIRYLVGANKLPTITNLDLALLESLISEIEEAETALPGEAPASRVFKQAKRAEHVALCLASGAER